MILDNNNNNSLFHLKRHIQERKLTLLNTGLKTSYTQPQLKQKILGNKTIKTRMFMALYIQNPRDKRIIIVIDNSNDRVLIYKNLINILRNN